MALLCSGLAACGERLSYSGDINPPDLSDARTRALDWLDLASSNEAVLSTKALTVASYLRERQIVALTDTGSASPCDGSGENSITLAFVLQPVDGSQIYVCQAGRDTKTDEKSQILIHEAIHLTGIKDECETTLLENVLVYASGRSPYHNAYVRTCGIELSEPADYQTAMQTLTQ